MKKIFLLSLLSLSLVSSVARGAGLGEDAGHFVGAFAVTDVMSTALENDPQLNDPFLGEALGVGGGVFASVLSESSNSHTGMNGWQFDRFMSDIGGVLLCHVVQTRLLKLRVDF